MTKHINVKKPLSRSERLRVTVAVGAFGAAATAATVGLATGAFEKPDTHEKTVRVEFDEDTPTLYDAALELRGQGATESVRDLQRELQAAEPGHDGVVHPGDIAEVQIDVQNKN